MFNCQMVPIIIGTHDENNHCLVCLMIILIMLVSFFDKFILHSIRHLKLKN